jgi:endonuclease/exonuclease/phosphatase family metal-dependent hydrolase
MALVSQLAIREQNLVLYNTHLESRGNHRLRCSQLSELCKDIRQFDSEVPVVVAGDFNIDLCDQPAAEVLRNLQFANPFGCASGQLANVSPHLMRSRSIDWILTTGPLIASDPKLYDLIHASDHSPLSILLRWK